MTFEIIIIHGKPAHARFVCVQSPTPILKMSVVWTGMGQHLSG